MQRFFVALALSRPSFLIKTPFKTLCVKNLGKIFIYNFESDICKVM